MEKEWIMVGVEMLKEGGAPWVRLRHGYHEFALTPDQARVLATRLDFAAAEADRLVATTPAAKKKSDA